MRWDNIYLAGLGVHLPEEVYTAEQAVADGVYDATAAETNGIRAVRVAGPGESGPVMAAVAGRQAVERSGHRPEDFDAVLHAYVGHQGREFWSPAHYVQQETVGANGASVTMEIRQGSNGLLGGIELAASHLIARPSATAALITSGDAFHLPFIDRWTSDDQTVFGDGAAAAVVSKRGGFAKVISTVSATEPSLEPLYRGPEPWSRTPFDDGKPVNLTARKDDWLMKNEDAYDDAVGLVGQRVAGVLEQLLDEAEMTLKDAQWFVHATLIRPIAEWSFYKTLDLDPATTTYEWGLDYAHMGNCDQFAGINHLYETNRLKSGDRLVTIGAGIGFMWTAAVIEIV
ncbi:ketoacyl-ACP synthase III family protein [Micromonospora sp. LH3U1]|uniref:ketoacyl-ACP synthase III family protein n=1 Tax=Micromonospora sp. LH3U1 TaxID=3018339 RepID=UPI00234BA5CD|nr:ketoacyl-ACP synthase III family protein [Micromonospora sp. LH3U1]WCN83971.1 ketoacyl-ACP synthase III family protein [Micromonospora sp. LH3U1]